MPLLTQPVPQAAAVKHSDRRMTTTLTGLQKSVSEGKTKPSYIALLTKSNTASPLHTEAQHSKAKASGSSEVPTLVTVGLPVKSTRRLGPTTQLYLP